ncbi:MAG TPA: hypothetical protein PKL70_16210 [Saprospiraceae bacterium]|nr:hypothetical protein [Saprospiraceae bacterium]
MTATTISFIEKKRMKIFLLGLQWLGFSEAIVLFLFFTNKVMHLRCRKN